MDNLNSGYDLLNIGETALCVFTKGDRYHDHGDGTGQTGDWTLDPDREFHTVIVYLDSDDDTVASPVFQATPRRVDGPNEDGRYVIQLGDLRQVGITTEPWKTFANTSRNPVRFLSKLPPYEFEVGQTFTREDIYSAVVSRRTDKEATGLPDTTTMVVTFLSFRT